MMKLEINNVEVTGKRNLGRQKVRWSDCLSKDLKERKLKEEDAIDCERCGKKIMIPDRQISCSLPQRENSLKKNPPISFYFLEKPPCFSAARLPRPKAKCMSLKFENLNIQCFEGGLCFGDKLGNKWHHL